MNYTINISLPKKLGDMAKAQVEAGYYSSMSEMVRDALRSLIAQPKIPVIKLSTKANKRYSKDYQDYLDGKLKEFSSFDEFNDYIMDKL